MTKKCPYCAEEVQEEAVKCKHCGSWLAGEPAAPAAALPADRLAAPAPRRLLRSSSNRMLAGVCGGLARYLGVDPTLFRLVVVLVVLFTAIVPGVIAYLVAALVIPSDDSPPPP